MSFRQQVIDHATQCAIQAKDEGMNEDAMHSYICTEIDEYDDDVDLPEYKITAWAKCAIKAANRISRGNDEYDDSLDIAEAQYQEDLYPALEDHHFNNR